MTAVTVAHPWRKTVRTAFQALVAAAAIAPGVYQAATQQDPTQATGWLGGGLVVAAAITRVMALPAVEVFLRRFVPFLAAQDVNAESVAAQVSPNKTETRFVAGPAAPAPDGTPVTVITTR